MRFSIRNARIQGLLLILGICASGPICSAQLFGADAEDIPALIGTQEFWDIASTQISLRTCAEDFRKSQPEQREQYRASERHRSAKRFQDCLAFIKAPVVGEFIRAGSTERLQELQLQFDAAQRFAARNVAETGAEDTFMGLRFGVGVGISVASSDRISDAEIAADSTIRANKDETKAPRVLLESHYYGWCRTKKCKAGKFGFGPYFGIVAKNDKVLSAVSFGGMVGWRDSSTTSPTGFSIGAGWVLDDGVTSLAEGFEVGKPLPAGETAIEYTEKARWGGILFFTRTF